MSMVAQLKSEYGKAGVGGGMGAVQLAGNASKDNGFVGSGTRVSVIMTKTLSYQAPACIASPVVHLEAGEVLELGTEGQGESHLPVRLYASDQLVIKTHHLIIGEIQFLVPPAEFTIICQKITLLTPQVPCEAHTLIQNAVDKSQTTIEMAPLIASSSPLEGTYSLTMS